MQIKLSKISLAVVATTLLLSSTTVLAANYKGEASYKGEVPAAPCIQPLVLRDGFYLGAQVGYDSYRTRVSNGLTVAAVSFSHNPVIASNGFVGGIFGGYGMYWNNFYYLAGELFVNGSGANQAQTFTVASTVTGANSSVYTKVSTGTSWGISALPGLKVNDSTLAYVRLGYEQARIKGQSSYTNTTAAGVVTNNSSSKTNWQGGFNYGVGIETAVYPNLSLRGEYNHTSYNSFTNASGASFNPSDNQFMLGLNYHFA